MNAIGMHSNCPDDDGDGDDDGVGDDDDTVDAVASTIGQTLRPVVTLDPLDPRHPHPLDLLFSTTHPNVLIAPAASLPSNLYFLGLGGCILVRSSRPTRQT